MSVTQLFPQALRSRPSNPLLRRRRIWLPFGEAKTIAPGLTITIYSIVNEAGQPTGEVDIHFRSYRGYGWIGAITRRLDAKPFNLSDRAMFRVLCISQDSSGRAIGVHGEITTVVSSVPSIA